MLYLISYDISNDRRRQKLAKLLEGFGQRVQWSVFECDLDQREYGLLAKKLKKVVREKEGDNLRIYRLCATCAQQTAIIGSGPAVEQRQDVYIV
ncbi:CRISPR-associated endonuclease Cas2 [Chloroflexia bacterium SDU3-3]|nr:CRISPR-associated endonuclease Cas2 [Chloroflexia bacterium SDU3-3]